MEHPRPEEPAALRAEIERLEAEVARLKTQCATFEHLFHGWRDETIVLRNEIRALQERRHGANR